MMLRSTIRRGVTRLLTVYLGCIALAGLAFVIRDGWLDEDRLPLFAALLAAPLAVAAGIWVVLWVRRGFLAPETPKPQQQDKVSRTSPKKALLALLAASLAIVIAAVPAQFLRNYLKERQETAFNVQFQAAMTQEPSTAHIYRVLETGFPEEFIEWRNIWFEAYKSNSAPASAQFMAGFIERNGSYAREAPSEQLTVLLASEERLLHTLQRERPDLCDIAARDGPNHIPAAELSSAAMSRVMEGSRATLDAILAGKQRPRRHSPPTAEESLQAISAAKGNSPCEKAVARLAFVRSLPTERQASFASDALASRFPNLVERIRQARGGGRGNG